jgi:hypothetical protein
VTIYDDDLCPDCCEEPCRCYEADQTCDLCGTPGCPGYCDDYQTYNLRPEETGGAEADPVTTPDHNPEEG